MSTENLTPKTILQDYFGFSRFRQYQEEIIDSLIAGQDAFALMPTGGGKSVCFQIPSMIRQGAGIVISPLIALMQDQVEGLKQNGVKADFLNSSLSYENAQAVIDRVIQGQIDLLYVAPERLLTTTFQRVLHQTQIALFAIDEAHCISQWGHDFRPEYLQIAAITNQFQKVPKIALTATADMTTRKEIIEKLHLSQARQFIASFNRPNIAYRVAVKDEAKKQLKEFLQVDHPNESGIIYCQTRKKAEETAEWLVENGFNALLYHAGLDNAQRSKNQRRFLREDNIIMVATVAFGMGIDKPDVRFVAHFDMPKSIESYYQETGRAGRDGLPAEAWMLYSLSDIAILRGMIEKTDGNEEFKLIQQRRIETMLGYCEAARCRRQILLGYFGEELPEPCGNCDVCLGNIETYDGTLDAKKALSCVYRTKQLFGAEHLADVLIGKGTAKVLQFGHDKVSTFGIGKDLTKKEWRSVFRQLVAAGLLKMDIEGKGGFKLTPLSNSIFKGGQSVVLRKDPTPIRKKARFIARETFESQDMQYAFSAELFEELRALRLELADENGVPPFVIFHDVTLKELVLFRPQTLTDLKLIYGIGLRKLELYGQQFLEAIQDYANRHPEEQPQAIESTETSAPINPKKAKTCSPTALVTASYANEGKSPEEIAALRNITLRTIYSHLSVAIEWGEIDLTDVITLPDDEIQSIEDAFLEPPSETMYLKPVFERFNGKYDYPILECVRANILAKRNIHNKTEEIERPEPEPEKTKEYYDIVCLANARKYSGYCFAGKEIVDNRIGRWYRVLTDRPFGVIMLTDFVMEDGTVPEILDIIAAPLKEPAPQGFHSENYLALEKRQWKRKGKFPLAKAWTLCDDADSIWICGHSGQYGINDRIPEELAQSIQTSLLLIQPNELSFLTQMENKNKKKVRVFFDYKGESYRLPVTDPAVEKIYLNKQLGVFPIQQNDLLLCLSLSEPFQGYCYKLVAGVIGFTG